MFHLSLSANGKDNPARGRNRRRAPDSGQWNRGRGQGNSGRGQGNRGREQRKRARGEGSGQRPSDE